MGQNERGKMRIRTANLKHSKHKQTEKGKLEEEEN